MVQLVRVLNYAHDQGGRRVILINQTSYSNEQLLAQIETQLPRTERERSLSRLKLLLCETEQSIFGYDQFNGHIETATPASSSSGSHSGLQHLSIFNPSSASIDSFMDEVAQDGICLD